MGVAGSIDFALLHFGPWSILPAVVAIVLAIATRNVILSLFTAVAVGGVVRTHGDIVAGVVHSIETSLVGALADADHAKTILFTVLIGGMVGIIAKSGGTRAVVEALAKRAKSPRSVQLLSWLSGMLVFFDDYANCMIVGSAMGPLCDKHKVSRAKLAYVVDSTAAPVASLALVSTWVGFEVGVIADGLKAAERSQIEPYAFFVQGWPYRFYPILAMLFVGMVVWSKRDFAAMRAADAAAEPPKQAEVDEANTAPWWVAALPVIALIAVTMGVLWVSGSKKAPAGAALFQVLANADGYGAILLGAFCSVVLAAVLALATRSLDLAGVTEAAVDGMKLMFEALIVLLLAWALSAVMKSLGAPHFLVGALQSALPAALLPTVVFLIGAAISFAVGSSYTTMGVLMPMVVPLAFALSPNELMIPLAASGSVLAGACFGDHCSPISDTTVLSSIGSGSDLLLHVRTQLPYALAVGGVSVVCGTLPAGFGVNPWLCCALGLVGCGVILRFVAQPAAELPAEAAAGNTDS